MADTLAAALWLAERNLHVFDLDHPELPRCVGVRTREHDPATCTERGKHPCGAWSKQATTDREQITAMFVGTTRNIGIACGPSGLLVVDEDVIGELARFCESNGQKVPDTFRVRTGKGWHFYFRQPAGAQLGNSEGALRGYGVNVRGVGGYVVGPGSTHATGEVYMPADVNAEILPCPSWLVDALTGKTGQAGDDPFTYPTAAKDHSWWRDVETIHHPNRHNALFAAAGWCRAMGIARDDAVTVVRDVWRRCCPGTCCRDEHGNPAKAYTWELAAARLEDAYERYEAGRDLPPRGDDESDADYERRAHHARRVATEVDRLQVIDEAREILDRARRGEVPPFDADLLDAVLERPAEPPDRVEGLLPTDGRLLVVAQRKTGKTTFGLNLALALIDGGHFLGRFAVRPIAGNIAVLNYEVTGRQLAKWAQEVGVPGDRLLLVNLRGRRNPLGYVEDRARLVDLLREHSVEVLLVDPFGRAFTGRNQNDASEVTPWLADLDRLADAAGITELALSTHAGWDGERSRGSSALEDWADSIATMTRDPEDQATRYLSAFGRDVEVGEDRLAFDAATRALTLTGAGSRRQGRTERAVAAAEADVLAYVKANPGCSVRNIRDGLPGANGVLDEARKRLVLRGDMKEADSKRRGGGKAYNVVDQAGEQLSVPGVPNRAEAHLGGVPGVSTEGTPLTAHLTGDQPRHTSEAST